MKHHYLNPLLKCSNTSLGTEYVYLTHSLIPLASRTDLGVGDVQAPAVHLSTPLITDYRQVDSLQDIIMAGAWKSSRMHFKASVVQL